jgi:hypothetical protein
MSEIISLHKQTVDSYLSLCKRLAIKDERQLNRFMKKFGIIIHTQRKKKKYTLKPESKEMFRQRALALSKNPEVNKKKSESLTRFYANNPDKLAKARERLSAGRNSQFPTLTPEQGRIVLEGLECMMPWKEIAALAGVSVHRCERYASRNGKRSMRPTGYPSAYYRKHIIEPEARRRGLISG